MNEEAEIQLRQADSGVFSAQQIPYNIDNPMKWMKKNFGFRPVPKPDHRLDGA